MLILFVGELMSFMTITVGSFYRRATTTLPDVELDALIAFPIQVEDRLLVDPSIEEELGITMNITFVRADCKKVHLDLQVNDKINNNIMILLNPHLFLFTCLSPVPLSLSRYLPRRSLKFNF